MGSCKEYPAYAVHRWWWHRNNVAQKTGIIIPDETYELAVGTPPTISLDVKDLADIEQWKPRKTYNLRNSKISSNSRFCERSSSPCSEATYMTSRDSMFPIPDISSNTDVSTSEPSSILGKRPYTQFSSSTSRSSSPAFDSSCSDSLPHSSTTACPRFGDGGFLVARVWTITFTAVGVDS
jgi:ribosomal protein S27AE